MADTAPLEQVRALLPPTLLEELSTLWFQHIVDECRMRQAAHEFRRRSRVSLAQTALRLGYSEHSTFTRAFARWSGMPPQSYIRNGLTVQGACPEHNETRIA